MIPGQDGADILPDPRQEHVAVGVPEIGSPVGTHGSIGYCRRQA